MYSQDLTGNGILRVVEEVCLGPCASSVTCSEHMSDKKQVKKEGFFLAHSSRVPSIMTERAWWQKLETAGHMHPQSGSRRKSNPVCRSFLLSILSRS